MYFRKTFVFHICKTIGLFHLSRILMRRRLLILCYHGFQLLDEARFRPTLFMQDSTLKQRLATLQRYRFPVLPLEKALERLEKDSIPNNAVCITIDDGFFSVLSKAAPLLKDYGMPATLYLTSYYSGKETPIFRLVVQYMFWKTSVTSLDLSDRSWGPDTAIELSGKDVENNVLWDIIDYGENECDEAARQDICHLLGARLGIDYKQIVDSRILSLLNRDELSALYAQSFDIQLHTHRHRLPVDNELVARREIRENKAFLRRLLGIEKTHLCYPSGVWSRRQWPWLERERIASATTCEPGFNTATTPLLGLYRILDQDNLSQIEFEAELFGFSELVRIITGKRRRTDAKRNTSGA